MSFYVEWGRLMARANLSDSRLTDSNLNEIPGNTTTSEVMTAFTLCPMLQHALQTTSANSTCNRRSTREWVEKKPRVLIAIEVFKFLGGTCGGRTHDKRIKSPLLYQLS